MCSVPFLPILTSRCSCSHFLPLPSLKWEVQDSLQGSLWQKGQMKLVSISSCEKHTDKGLRKLVLVQSHPSLIFSPKCPRGGKLRSTIIQVTDYFFFSFVFSISKGIASTLEQKAGIQRRKREGGAEDGMDIKGNRRRAQTMENNKKKGQKRK